MKGNYSGNLGWLFHNDYYRKNDLSTVINKDWLKINYEEEDKKIKAEINRVLDKKNKQLLSFKLKGRKNDNIGKQKIECKTIYPGLLIGSGLIHGIGEKEDFTIGFQFDHTSGLPIIPGSSVKGLLRSVFPEDGDVYKEEKEEYIRSLIEDITEVQVDIESLRDEIFEGRLKDGKRMPLAKRDIFFAAQVIKGDRDNMVLGEDYITPHGDPLKDPQPLKFLKVLPDVVFEFNFDLKDSNLGFSKKDKLKLFKDIILDFGVGAKTNVGYGYFDRDYTDKMIRKREEELEAKKEEEARKKREAELAKMSELDRRLATVFDDPNINEVEKELKELFDDLDEFGEEDKMKVAKFLKDGYLRVEAEKEEAKWSKKFGKPSKRQKKKIKKIKGILGE
ncbi:type III-B CRISPR module RAMP protein Cmr6 [Halonatronum saccharophilum]|uniref:type III-B CRISPR module RAMP protein Cmr6 n=1 Tax=Halonatronum saccharophilum TaxID=150060 RepID=UPI0004B7ED6D|nr:type III-B CRISPR module RAMP protein Cmr6 [Halonatronum saccharophilum]